MARAGHGKVTTEVLTTGKFSGGSPGAIHPGRDNGQAFVPGDAFFPTAAGSRETSDEGGAFSERRASLSPGSK